MGGLWAWAHTGGEEVPVSRSYTPLFNKRVSHWLDLVPAVLNSTQAETPSTWYTPWPAGTTVNTWAHLRTNHTFKIILHQLSTQIIKLHVCLIHCYIIKNQPSIYHVGIHTHAHTCILHSEKHTDKTPGFYTFAIFVSVHKLFNSYTNSRHRHLTVHSCLQKQWIWHVNYFPTILNIWKPLQEKTTTLDVCFHAPYVAIQGNICSLF